MHGERPLPKGLAKVVVARLEEDRLRKSLDFWQVLVHYDMQNEAYKFTVKDRR